jgi:hypothetical protein
VLVKACVLCYDMCVIQIVSRSVIILIKYYYLNNNPFSVHKYHLLSHLTKIFTKLSVNISHKLQFREIAFRIR